MPVYISIAFWPALLIAALVALIPDGWGTARSDARERPYLWQVMQVLVSMWQISFDIIPPP